MVGTVLLWTAAIVGAVVLFLILQAIYLSLVLRWENEQTVGLAYYGLPPTGRERFKRRLRLHARLLMPILRVIGRTSKFTFANGSFTHHGIAGPKGTCSEQSFARADEYTAQPEDVFVVTQMKCGTTWMQHVVYQVLMRGAGDLVESGTALYAVSPWIEALKSVTVEDAPLLGTERPSRLIKTHLPAQLCPWSDDARYIYVARHPVSCFASCMDFIATNIGAMAPGLEACEQWFTSSELMWWGTWTDHVKGWWERARHEDNVLFIFFEDMRRDLPAVVRRIADFLGVAPLSDDELAQVVEKCGFSYMQQHKDTFEMHPPHILQTDAELFVRGTADRHKDVPDDVRQRLLAWCAAELDGSDFPVEQAYPDVGAVRV